MSFRSYWLLAPAVLILTSCSSAPEVKPLTASELESKKYPVPPTIFSHTMTPAHTARMERVRYSPSAIFQLKDCEGCIFVYDQTTITTNGEVSTVPGIGVENSRFSDEASILNKFGVFQGGALSSETSWASIDIVKFCYHNLRICRSEDPSTCTALNPKLGYELDLQTGLVNTNLPVTDPNLRSPANAKKKFRSICPNLRKIKSSKQK